MSGFEDAFGIVSEWVDAARIPGAVLGVSEGLASDDGRGVPARGFVTTVRAAGSAQLQPVRRPMTEHTWFDLASLTKVIFTAPRVLNAAAAGAIDLDAPITAVLPDLRQWDLDAWQRDITPRQCLAHATGLPASWPIYTYGTDPAQLRAFVLQRDWPRGEHVYSDLGFMLLGFVLERLAGVGIRQYHPGAGFAWGAGPTEAAATEFCPWRGRMLVGEVHDENAAAMLGAGHAGLFGTAGSVLGYARGLLDGTVAHPSAIELMRTPADDHRTYGWEHRYQGWSGGDACSPATIGHTGFTGTGLWIDFDAGRAWTLLTNRVHPSRWSDSGIAELRRRVGDALAA
jgi:CubicO group peptidase (beta-lactamase class C family)